MTLADSPQVQALSAREKLQLVDELWTEVTSKERQLLDERWVRFLCNPSSALTLEEFQNGFTRSAHDPLVITLVIGATRPVFDT